jgi:hypothetical protein
VALWPAAVAGRVVVAVVLGLEAVPAREALLGVVVRVLVGFGGAGKVGDHRRLVSNGVRR